MYTDCLNHLLAINFSFADASWLVDYINCTSGGGYDYVYNENTYSWDCVANPRFFRMSVKRENTFAPVPDDMPCPDTVVFGILAPGSDCERNYMDHSNYKKWLFDNNKSAVYSDLMAYINGNDNSCDVSKHAVADSAISYMIANNNSQQSQSFVQQCIAQMQQNPGLNLDIAASANSPCFIDFSAIDTTTPEGQKFMEVYNALLDSPSFKDLFLDVFQDSDRFNVILNRLFCITYFCIFVYAKIRNNLNECFRY